jgi:adenosine deaminase
MDDLYEEIRRMPKYELHRHLDGSLTGEDAYRIGMETGVITEETSLEDFIKQTTIQNGDNIPTILSKFNKIIDVMQTPDGLQQSFVREAKKLREENIVYAELRFAPFYHLKQGMTLEEVMKNSLRGARIASEQGLGVGVIFCINREIEPEKSVYLVEEIINSKFYKHPNFAGLDEACDESQYPTGRHATAFQLAIDSGIKCTSHSGEMGGNRLDNLWNAVEQGVDRVGQAIDLWRNKELMDVVSRGEIGIESCPLSNLFCGFTKSIKENGLRTLLENGVFVGLNSDDPARFGKKFSLTHVYYQVTKAYGFTIDELKQFNDNSMITRFVI